jgi:hypothetical protein
MLRTSAYKLLQRLHVSAEVTNHQELQAFPILTNFIHCRMLYFDENKYYMWTLTLVVDFRPGKEDLKSGIELLKKIGDRNLSSRECCCYR